MRKTMIACVTFLAAVPILAHAWPPYAPGPGTPSAYAGYPGYYGQPYGMPSAPWSRGYPEGWDRAPASSDQLAAPSTGQDASSPGPWTSPAGHDWASRGRPLGSRPMPPRLDVSRGVDGNDYVIDIQVQNIDPQQIQIRRTARGLVLAYDRSVQQNRSDDLPGGEGYRRSYSISRGMSTHRIGLPADAKLEAMSRELGDGQIRLRIPKDSSAQSGRW